MTLNPVRLTAAEAGYLWTGYNIDSMSYYVLQRFAAHAENKEVKELLLKGMELAFIQNKHRSVFFRIARFPVPIGFDETDVITQSPPLFTDEFSLLYLCIAARMGIRYHATSLSRALRADQRTFVKECLQGAIRLYEDTLHLLQKAGIDIRPPSLPNPESPEFVQKPSFFHAFMGDQRPMNTMEIGNLFGILEMLQVLKAMSIGFAQCTADPEVKAAFEGAVEMSDTLRERFEKLCKADNLPVPRSLETEVTGSKTAPFSDRLMLCHISGFAGSLISMMGAALGSSLRNDIAAVLGQCIATTGIYTERASKLLVEREWLEKVPGAVDRKALV